SWVSLRRSSAFIGWAMTGMRLRSAELKAYASISSSVTSRRYAAASRVAATPASAATLALAQRLRLLGPVGLDVERSRPLVQLLVLADLRLGAERRRHALAEGPLAALAVRGAHVTVDHEAAVVRAQVGRRAVHGVERPQKQVARLHLAGHGALGVEPDAAQVI